MFLWKINVLLENKVNYSQIIPIVRTLKLKKSLFFEFNAPTIQKDEFSIFQCNISALTLGMMWSRKVDLDAEIKGDNLVPPEMQKKLLDHLSRCVYVLLIVFSSK